MTWYVGGCHCSPTAQRDKTAVKQQMFLLYRKKKPQIIKFLKYSNQLC